MKSQEIKDERNCYKLQLVENPSWEKSELQDKYIQESEKQEREIYF